VGGRKRGREEERKREERREKREERREKREERRRERAHADACGLRGALASMHPSFRLRVFALA
jgi:hypothetical protein